MIDNLKLIQTDSVINDYLDDIEAYLDEKKRHILATDNRAINKVRKWNTAANKYIIASGADAAQH